ncbi:MAG: DNA/RNA non-specific endonuclease [Kiritimatiellae bacterium]|nr:DNA/RNA non-specific endonuclease [Kiritimatiellia bacterium]
MAAASIAVFILWSCLSLWFVHHPRGWIEEKCRTWPRIATIALLSLGEPLGDLTDGLGLTGSDVTAETDRPPPSGKVFFAGMPVRRSAPAPDDIRVLNRGDFIVGWSPSLMHPAWCAYHVPKDAAFEPGKRPGFRKDPRLKVSPKAADYARTGYDRGHMAPNYAIATRFGPVAQTNTFCMSNIAPQTPALNRGVWRDIEHRIVNLWTARWGEIWVVVGALSEGCEKLNDTGIDIPTRYWQVVVAQDGKEIRALALLVEQDVPWRAWPARYLISIDELEDMTGYDFLAELDDDTEAMLESRCPSRLWPIRLRDLASLMRMHSQDDLEWSRSKKK